MSRDLLKGIPMKLSLPFLLAIALAASEAAAQEQIDERFPASRDGTVKITNAAGSVHVIGWDEDSVAISGSLGEGAERLATLTGGRESGVRVVLRRDARDIGGTELEVRVPRSSQVAVRTSSADIDISNVNGTLDLESVSGAIRVSGTPRMVYAESAGGNVELDVSTKVARAKSIDGDVRVQTARGYVEISTVSGNAFLVGDKLWEGEISSVSGDIRYEGDFSPEGSLRIESHGGKIELVLPDEIAADFDITTLAGASVVNAFASGGERTFSIAGGGAQVRIKSFKGNVIITKR